MNSQSTPATPGLSSTLVFPATHPDGRKYIQEALERGQPFVAATSEVDAEPIPEVDALHRLPYVYAPEFPEMLLGFVAKHGVSRIYAPVAAVHSWLHKFIADRGLTSVQLIGASPIKREMQRLANLLGKVAGYQAFVAECAASSTSLSELEIAAVFRMSHNIYGESNDQKIAAMMAIFSTAPQGDVVEVGSLVGKSASVLTFLSKRFNVGHVLAVDPWSDTAATQNDSPATVRVHMLGEWDYEDLPRNLTISLLPLGLGTFNYLRLESARGARVYASERTVSTEAFGTVEYSGKIAVLHIDGNHDYFHVRQDCEVWLPHLREDGWLILDDYIWAHGDGPRRVGDDLLVEQRLRIERSFVCGKALFVKFCAPPPDGHPKLLQAGRVDYADSGTTARRAAASLSR